jgi:hypothetical protein
MLIKMVLTARITAIVGILVALGVTALTLAQVSSFNSIREEDLNENVKNEGQVVLQYLDVNKYLVSNTCGRVCAEFFKTCAPPANNLFVGWQLPFDINNSPVPLNNCNTVFTRDTNDSNFGSVVCQCIEQF